MPFSKQETMHTLRGKLPICMSGIARGRALLAIQGSICVRGTSTGGGPTGHTGGYLRA